MKFPVVVLLLVITYTVPAQNYCISGMFSENAYFPVSDVQFFFNISYGNATHWYGTPNPSANTFNIALPPTADPLVKNPCIVLVHGGGFLNGDKNYYNDLIQQLAQRGFVAATLDYRLGWESNGDAPLCMGNVPSFSEAFYMAVQDVDAAMRYLTFHADEYGIDTSELFMGGESAGSFAVLNDVFTSQEEINSLFPALEPEFGPLRSATNPIETHFTVKGILNMWGAIFDTAWIDSDNAVPIASFFGDRDSIVPAGSAPLMYCTTPVMYPIVYGSRAISERLDELGICNTLHENPGGSHYAYDFDYLIPNISCFVKSILCNDCISGHYDFYSPQCDAGDTTLIVNSDENSLVVFPDPASGFITIVPGITSPQDITFTVFGVNGQAVQVPWEATTGMVSADVSGLSPGLYLAVLTGSGKRFTAEFAVMH